MLAKYSCIALRRIGGSEKKVKGSLTDKSIRLQMDNPIFRCLKELVEAPTTNKEWCAPHTNCQAQYLTIAFRFGMAEQAINTIYVLGDQPDALCSQLLQNLTERVFSNTTKVSPPPATDGATPKPDAESNGTPAPEQGDNLPLGDEQAGTPTAASQSATPQPPAEPAEMADAFDLAQLIFAAGHVAIKHLVHLELVEREYKRRKEVEKTAAPEKAGAVDELDQVAGSLEDDIADIVQEAKERELLYGPKSLLAMFGPMTVQICQFPKVYRVRLKP